MAAFNLSKVKFTKKADVVNPGTEIFNPKTSHVDTLQGDDQIIGTANLTGDFGFGVYANIAATDSNHIASADLSGEATVAVYGIKNEGTLNTNNGSDIVRGKATASISVIAATISKVIAIVQKTDAVAIAKAFASIDIKATADGIDNSGGKIYTGKGSDAVNGSTEGSLTAVALASADTSAIIEAIAKAPMSQGLTAFAKAIATSLAKATLTATGIKNIGGTINTDKGNDTLSASATSSTVSITSAGSNASTWANTTPDNQALAMAVADATAKASASSKAIAIDNTRGIINTGKDNDTIEANASASGRAIAIDNTKGMIDTGDGNDTIIAKATGLDSYGIFGNGTIDTGKDNDRVIASSFGGGVNIDMGEGNDFVQGFGYATVNGGKGFDTLSLGSYNRDNFQISFGTHNNNSVTFQLDGITMTTTGFEKFNFANSVSYTYDQLSKA